MGILYIYTEIWYKRYVPIVLKFYLVVDACHCINLAQGIRMGSLSGEPLDIINNFSYNYNVLTF